MGSLAGRTFLALLLAACLPVAAAAGSSTYSTPEECVSIADNAARLQCYDEEMGRTIDEDEGFGPLDSRWELSRNAKRGLFRFRPYKPVYLAPYSWTSDRNPTPRTPNQGAAAPAPQELDRIEAKFQVSTKFKLAENIFGKNGDLWGAYTQASRWQVYNTANSRPFRETNYEPELIFALRTKYRIFGWKGRLAGIGLNHQSNGRGDPLSRSWNRIIGIVGLERDDWVLVVRPWRRIDESAAEDDNPDIADFLGRGDLTVTRLWGGHQFTLMGRHSLHGGRRSHGAVQFEWAFPIRDPLRGRVQLFHGYGESLIDYNHKATWVTVGFSLVEWY
ncbi:MAG: phospholipase A [Thermodesulfobacteriota bacterium]